MKVALVAVSDFFSVCSLIGVSDHADGVCVISKLDDGVVAVCVATRSCVRMWWWPSALAGEDVWPPITEGAVEPNVLKLHYQLEEHSGDEC